MPTVMRCMLYPYFGESVLPVLEVDCLRSSMGEKPTAVIMRFDYRHDIWVNGNYTIFPRRCFPTACYNLPLKVDVVRGQGKKLRDTKARVDLDNSIVNERLADMIEELFDFFIGEDVSLRLLVGFAAIEVDRIHLADDIPVIAPRIKMRKQIADGTLHRITPGTVVKGGLEIMLANGAVGDIIQFLAMYVVDALVIRHNSREHLLECFFAPCRINLRECYFGIVQVERSVVEFGEECDSILTLGKIGEVLKNLLAVIRPSFCHPDKKRAAAIA